MAARAPRPSCNTVIAINNEGHIIGDIQVVDASGKAIRYLGRACPALAV